MTTEERELDIEDSKVKFKTVVIIVVAIVFYVISLSGVYFKNQAEIEKAMQVAADAKEQAAAANAKAISCQEQINAINANYILTKYQLDELKAQMTLITTNTNEIYKLVRNYR